MAGDDDGRLMRIALDATRAAMAHGGGPFGAVVADGGGRVLAVGANMVLVLRDPTAHAEVTAIRRATALLGRRELRDCTLVATCAPCIMCTGAIHWAGVGRLVTGARATDAEAIGFVEGPAGFDAMAFLRARGIAVEVDVERDAAAALLRAYTGPIYNG
jgi:tRNA(Arg) A34 adenosine deaminase TadA